MNPEYRPSKSIKIHLICWTVFIAYEALIAGMVSGQYAHLVYYVMFYALNISLFYFHSHVVMARSFDKGSKTVWRLPFLLAIEIVIYVGIYILLSFALELLKLRSTPLQFNSRFFITAIWRSALFMMFSTGYYFLHAYMRRAKREMARALAMEQLNAKLVRAERDFLKAQINPHLLFNTLNFVRYASKRKPEQVDDAILRLSELMRFAMEKTATGLIPIEQELAQIENIIQLNQLRFEGKLNINYYTELNDNDVQLIPTVLLTLVENVFKHGYLLDPASPAEIIFKGDRNRLVFTTTNVRESGNEHYPSLKNGLINIQSRLENTYGKNASFENGILGDKYWTKLIVEFKPSPDLV